MCHRCLLPSVHLQPCPLPRLSSRAHLFALLPASLLWCFLTSLPPCLLPLPAAVLAAASSGRGTTGSGGRQLPPTGLRAGWNHLRPAQGSSRPPPARAPRRPQPGCAAGAARAAAATMAPRRRVAQAELTGCFLEIMRTPRGVFSSLFLCFLHFLSSSLCPPYRKCWFR